MLLSDWCGSDLKIEFEDIRGAYEVTFTAPPANGSTVTISPLTRLVIDKDGYPAVYIVLSDKTLHLIATQQPTSIEAFGEISGIGEYKKDKYGKEFVELIKKKIGK